MQNHGTLEIFLKCQTLFRQSPKERNHEKTNDSCWDINYTYLSIWYDQWLY
jgi:hypothetical protein